jgi:hypothetical protein
MSDEEKEKNKNYNETTEKAFKFGIITGKGPFGYLKKD